MYRERNSIMCKTCGTVTCHFLIVERKEDIEYNVYKCETCKKYARGKDRRRQIHPTAQEKENIEIIGTIPVDNGLKCEICKNNIDFSKRRKGSKTCGKKCEKILNQQRKDEYHRKRREKKE